MANEPGQDKVDGPELDREPIRARLIGAGERAWKWCRRRPAVAALSAGLVLALTVWAVGVLTQWSRARQERREALAARTEARRESYFSGVALAQRYLEEGDVARSKELLLSLPEELRHWERGHLLALCHQDVAASTPRPSRWRRGFLGERRGASKGKTGRKTICKKLGEWQMIDKPNGLKQLAWSDPGGWLQEMFAPCSVLRPR
ncbi:MAG: hypothetical protein HS113_03905 [Verrucomicrobiales bacterium]|nr:hypothetical protein [Verrucomicrobiales bacterium]